MKRGVAALKKLPRFALGEVGEKAESSKTRGQSNKQQTIHD